MQRNPSRQYQQLQSEDHVTLVSLVQQRSLKALLFLLPLPPPNILTHRTTSPLPQSPPRASVRPQREPPFPNLKPVAPAERPVQEVERSFEILLGERRVAVRRMHSAVETVGQQPALKRPWKFQVRVCRRNLSDRHRFRARYPVV